MRKIANKENNPSYHQKRQRSFRKALLSKLLENIENGQMNMGNSEKQINPSRPEYKSPVDRNTYNYGYMESDEFEAGTPNVW